LVFKLFASLAEFERELIREPPMVYCPLRGCGVTLRAADLVCRKKLSVSQAAPTSGRPVGQACIWNVLATTECCHLAFRTRLLRQA